MPPSLERGSGRGIDLRQDPTRDPDERVFVRIGFAETDLRVAIKSAGGRWNQERRLWELRVATAYELGLDNRIVDDGPDR